MFKPLHDNIAIKFEKVPEKTFGGVILPEQLQETSGEGEVVAVGPGIRDKKGNLEPMKVKVGDTVLFRPGAGLEVKVDGEDILLLKNEYVLGVK